MQPEPLQQPMQPEQLNKIYDVENYGVVSRGNSIFMDCIDNWEVDSLEIGQMVFARFQSGAGIITAQVTRFT